MANQSFKARRRVAVIGWLVAGIETAGDAFGLRHVPRTYFGRL
jgi:hypothetical protein